MNNERIPPLPSREIVIAQQVQTLLNIVHTLTPLAVTPFADDWRETGHAELDGGVRDSVSVALMSACDRLESITSDSTRWGMEGQGALEKALGDMYEANTELLRVSTYAAKVAAAPVGLFKPMLGRLPDGSGWFAVHDEVVGTGENLEKAILDFNNQFQKRPNEANKLIDDSADYTKRGKAEPTKGKRKLPPK